MRLTKAAPAAVLFILALALAAAAQTHASGNRPPSVKLTASTSRVVRAFDCGESQACMPTASTVQLRAEATDPDGDALRYAYSTTGGRVAGDGPEVTLDLTGVAAGVYKVTLKVDDGRGGVASGTAAVNVELCSCPRPVPIPCPTVTVSCPGEPGTGKPVTFTAHVAGGDPGATPTYKWTVAGGKISGGLGTATITVDTSGGAARPLTATVEVGGYGRDCPNSTSCTLMPGLPLTARKVDEYGRISFGDEKARLDNFYYEVRNDPAAQAYLVCYGGRRGVAGEARRRCERARDYLAPTRGAEASRVVTVDGGRRDEPATELWLVPAGATPPAATPTFFPKGRR